MELSVFRVPEYDNQGNMTAQLFGRHAEVGLSSEVKIDQLRIEFYQAGSTVATVESPFCFYNTQKREAHSDAEVSAVADKITMTGRGFEWKPNVHTVRVLSDAKVVMEDAGRLKNTLLSGGLAYSPSADNGTAATGSVVTITSTELFLDYVGKIVQFEKEVHVTSSDGMEMRCEKLKIPLGDGHGDNLLALPGGKKTVAE